jgi:hypothetical protein
MRTGQLVEVAAAREAFARLLRRARRDGDCLLLGHTNRYPPVKIAGRQHPAHRIAFIATFGPPPADRPWVLHSCVDRKHCISPLHLRAGTVRDNARDALEAGRIVRGERHHRARLTEAIVRESRRRVAAGASMVELAREHGVAPSTMQSAIKRQSWTHVL